MRALIPLVLLIAAPVAAQTIAEQARALIVAKRAAVAAQARSVALERAAAEAVTAAAKARAQAAAVAARVRAAEADIAAGEARVRIVDARRRAQRARLAEGQAPIARLAAALQTLARRPPAFALVQPGSIGDVVHIRALLAASLPIVERRTAGLRAEVMEAERLTRQAAAAAATLRAGQARLEAERVTLARLETTERARSLELADSAVTQGDRATALGEQARDIVDLMAELGEQADVRDRLRTLTGPAIRPSLPGDAPAPRIPMMLEAATFDYRLPVIGRIVAGLGEAARSGVRAKGLTIVTEPGAQVVAPAAGRVAFAGPFRGYGRIVILDHGGGWTTLIAGLASTAVAVGDAPEAGAQIGRAPAETPRVTVELRHHDRPADVAQMVGG